jgi:transposase-like protein
MVILVVVALRTQRSFGITMEKLKRDLGVDSKTVRRWQRWYQERISPGGEWKELGSRFASGLTPGQEVQSLITAFVGENDAEGGMVRLLRFIAKFEHVP